MNKRWILTAMVVVVAVFAITQIQRSSAITSAEASLLSTVNSNEAYLQSQQTASWSIFGISSVAIILVIVIWAGEIRKLFLMSLMLLALAIVACAPATRAHTVVTNTNEITFVVQLTGDNTNQAVVGDNSSTSDEAFWKRNLVNRREITVEQYCFFAYQGATCDPRDSVAVITVSTSSVNVEWIAPAVIPGQPFPDMSSAFSMQSLEPNGGSTGVYVGAQLIAHVLPENAALYLASYGLSAQDERGTFPARPLVDVLQTEVRAFIQTELNIQYGQRSVVEQNRDMADMFTTVKDNLTTIFGLKGITIDSFGYRDGNVYENAAIQAGIDSAFERQRQLEEAQANAQRQAIVNAQLVDTSYAQATATMVAAQSAANAQQLQAEVLSQNPNLVQYELAQRWDGHLPQIVGDTNSIPMVPFALQSPAPQQEVSPQATPTPQP